jgi:chorismate dehydratase
LPAREWQGATAGRAVERMMRIGCVKYLNARPLIHGWPGGVEFGHPSTLCQRLANRELDIALVSSFEFLRNPIYRIVDDISISSDGPVYSVVVAHRGDFSAIQEIELDPASETAVNLLRCLLAELRLNLRLVPGTTGCQPGVAGSLPATPNARLLIGDQAIQFRQKHAGELQFWDLGEQWKELANLPFVYALWLIRPEVANAKSIAQRLRALRDKNLANLDDFIAKAVADMDTTAVTVAEADDPGQRQELHREFLSRYFRKHLRFNFGEEEKTGLRTFASLCTKQYLLPKRDLELSLV